MSRNKHQVWAMMPLLGILLMSPKDVTHKYGRSIASAEPTPVSQEQKPEVKDPQPLPEGVERVPDVKPEEVRPVPSQAQKPVPSQSQKPEVKPEVKPQISQTPKLDALLPKDERDALPARQEPVNLNNDILREEITTVLSKVHSAESFDPKTVTRQQLDDLKKSIRDGAIDLVQIERAIPNIIGGEENIGDLPERVRLARVSLEASLGELEQSEIAFAARPAPAPEAPAVATTPAPSEADRKPSVVTEETKPEVKPEVSETKPEVKPETKPEVKPESTDKDPVLCALEEQNKLLQTQLQAFVSQQSMIMQQLMSLTQMVMMQNMYRTPDTFNYRDAYQYHQPQVAGNWVYYPNGLQPIQPGQTQGQPDPQANIFGLNQQQPQMNPYMANQQQPQFPFAQPGMMNQGGMWGLQPQMNFQHPAGNFGMDALGFNFGNSPVAPSQQLGAGLQRI